MLPEEDCQDGGGGGGINGNRSGCSGPLKRPSQSHSNGDRKDSTSSMSSNGEGGGGGGGILLEGGGLRKKARPSYEPETDPTTLARRGKQIDYGKSTPEYQSYSEAVPKPSRQPHHPKTPNKFQKYSRRAWDGLIKQWRLNLHFWSQKADDHEIKMELGASASENGDGDKLNDSFQSEENTETSSASSSISAASGILFGAGDEVKVKQLEDVDLDATLVPNVDKLNDSRNFSTSWADEVEDYYENGCD